MLFNKNLKILFCILFFYSSPAFSFNTDSEYALLVDYKTNQILFEKNSTKRIFPASMSKLMTLYVLFDYLDKGAINMADEFVISENAWRKGGAMSDSSTMFAEVSSYISIENLIKGIVIQSGNDACIAVAEGISGSEDLFAIEMNFFSQELGMKDTNFKNSTGLHHKDHFTTATDLVILTKALIKNFPQYYHFFSQESFTWNGIFQPNRNNLLRDNIGVDGLKTGKTEESGFSMIVSSFANEIRLISILGGLPSKEKRTSEMRKLINYGQKAFKRSLVFKSNEVIDNVDVWGGKASSVDLVASEDIYLLLDIRGRRFLNVSYLYNSPITAPVKKGDIIGKITILNDDKIIIESNLISNKDIDSNNFIGKAIDTMGYLFN
ncbi:MAG: D-alanyl-D-alanine carboxypeptidase [Hyphomicrobiales bacterium]|nr:D-alanyl-D-alanine carboxypeptidase [Hyphomicrobiales bacterium]